MENIEKLETEVLKTSDINSIESSEALTPTDDSELDVGEINSLRVEDISEKNIDLESAEDVSEKLRFQGEDLEIVSDAEAKEQIAEYLDGVENLKYENWCNLTLDERTKLLNELEEKIASIEHRPPLKVNVEKMKPNEFGYQCSTESRIALNSLYVGGDDVASHRKMIETIIHEGRHAYQHYNVDVKSIHESGSEVATWRENFYDSNYGYYSYKGKLVPILTNEGIKNADFRLYYYQPVEIDARNFASDVMTKLDQRGLFGSE